MNRATAKQYYQLAKPGLVYGNLFSVLGGYLYGAGKELELATLFAVMLGSALIMGGGCVINNVIDRRIDIHMKRTKKRATVTGAISAHSALTYAAVLAIIGAGLLYFFTNTLTTLLGITGLVSYALIYTYAKPRTVHATLIGTIPGAIPLVAGYTAAGGQIDLIFWILFIIMIAWQMVHFYAISLFRKDDYKSAGVPTASVTWGNRSTKIQMIAYSMLFITGLILLSIKGHGGIVVALIMLPLSMWWLTQLLQGPRTTNDIAWARKSFGQSLLMLPALCGSLALAALIA